MSRFDSLYLNVLTTPDALRKELREVIAARYGLGFALGIISLLLFALLRDQGAWCALAIPPLFASVKVFGQRHRSLISLEVALDPETRSFHFIPQKASGCVSLIRVQLDPVEEAFFRATERRSEKSVEAKRPSPSPLN